MLVNEKKIDKKEVGLRIIQIRISNGHTLESFGKLFGAVKSNVQKWEIGFSLPNKERLANISKLANVTVNELLYGVNINVEDVYTEAIKLSNTDKMILVKKIMENMIDEGY